MLCEQVLCESQQQFSWRKTHVKPTHWVSSRDPTRLGLGVHFLEENCLELCGPYYTNNVRGLWSTDKLLHRGSVKNTCCQCAIVSISNLYRRKLDFDSEPLGVLALLSVLRVGM